MEKPTIDRDSAVWRRVASAVALFIISAAISGWTDDGKHDPKQFYKQLTVTSASAVLTGGAAAVVFGATALFAVGAALGVFLLAGRAVTAIQDRNDQPAQTVEQ